MSCRTTLQKLWWLNSFSPGQDTLALHRPVSCGTALTLQCSPADYVYNPGLGIVNNLCFYWENCRSTRTSGRTWRQPVSDKSGISGGTGGSWAHLHCSLNRPQSTRTFYYCCDIINLEIFPEVLRAIELIAQIYSQNLSCLGSNQK